MDRDCSILPNNWYLNFENVVIVAQWTTGPRRVANNDSRNNASLLDRQNGPLDFAELFFFLFFWCSTYWLDSLRASGPSLPKGPTEAQMIVPYILFLLYISSDTTNSIAAAEWGRPSEDWLPCYPVCNLINRSHSLLSHKPSWYWADRWNVV